METCLRRVHRTGGTESCSKRTPRPAEGMGHRIWLYCHLLHRIFQEWLANSLFFCKIGKGGKIHDIITLAAAAWWARPSGSLPAGINKKKLSVHFSYDRRVLWRSYQT
ncbi:hypothetical protein BEI59_33030 [Eisenbergiella tayi]|uniref:Uncharacterized protein n=1 Tax=Eisenbergiella tayi TaxID=1432052 RepID=A0A1E3U729_9FIRM|nr:hypothetical protein BEI59_33030 [Eisenbergiella tayi]ODR39829.1 hypothetical protein BEI60_06505 [Eisenbergiella tayi]ODR41784.1 hypothetical protein BEI62_06530 [Eisenbergiella tayi]ODR60790.1 hypothetical protein BEI63_03495 [Eisenbergiella tayi]RJW31445.1 hypothetical protein DXC97_32010 [Lachnospiraceae bacterium TF09-5]